METREVTVLVTGGAGYIGSHTIVKLLENGNKVVAIDNLVNSYQDPSQLQPESLIRAQALSGRRLYYENVDLLNSAALKNIFKKYKIDCVMHFAALKAVGESCSKPLEYYRNNVVGTINLLDAMREAECYRIIYSSSATVYGDPTALPLTEASPTGSCTNPYGATKHTAEMIMNDLCSSKKLSNRHKAKVFRLFRLLWTVASNINPLFLPISEKRTIGQGITNPYGKTKLIGEMILQDLCVSKDWKVISLRYFNPVGAHESGRLGEDPAGIPSNLMPYIAQVAIGKLDKLHVYGNDYPTPDGTGVRDYIHIQDLAYGHIKALDKIFEPTFSGFKPYNLGTGKGHSVLEVIHSFEKACGRKIKYEIAPRREGDVASCYCDARLANKELNWVATKTLQDMCADMWRWQLSNPEGYNGPTAA